MGLVRGRGGGGRTRQAREHIDCLVRGGRTATLNGRGVVVVCLLAEINAWLHTGLHLGPVPLLRCMCPSIWAWPGSSQASRSRVLGLYLFYAE